MKKTTNNTNKTRTSKKGSKAMAAAPVMDVAMDVTMDVDMEEDSLLASFTLPADVDGEAASLAAADIAAEVGEAPAEVVDIPAADPADVVTEGADAVAALDAPADPAEVVPAPSFLDVSDKGLAASVAYLTDKVAAGKVICKNGGAAMLVAAKGEKATVEARFYADRKDPRTGMLGRWSFEFVKGRGKKGGQQRQDYWVDVLLQYVTILP